MNTRNFPIFEVLHRYEGLNTKIYSQFPVESIGLVQMGMMQMINDYLDYVFQNEIAMIMMSGDRRPNVNADTEGAATQSNHTFRTELITRPGPYQGKKLIRCASDWIPVYASDLNKVVDMKRAFYALALWFKGEIYWKKTVHGKDGQGIIHTGQQADVIKIPWVTTVQGDIEWKQYFKGVNYVHKII